MIESILVTGAFGFVGRHVALAAAQSGFIVHGLGHGTWSRAEWSEWGLSEWHCADVTLDSLVSFGREPDLIIHCAGSGSVAFSMNNPAQDFDRSVMTTRSVLEYARLHRPSTRVVLPSSAAVYGNAEALPIKVDCTLRPASPYGSHKQMCEELCQSYSSHFGVKAAIVRLFSVYGVGLRKQLLWDACVKLAKGTAQFGGTGEETRDWLHVDDAARLLIAAGSSSDTQFKVVNGAVGVGERVRKVVQTLATEFGGRDTFVFSGVSRPGDPTHFVADISGALSLGWRPERILEVELLKFARWFKDGAH